MNRSRFLLGALLVAAAVLVSCIRVPEITLKPLAESISQPESPPSVGSDQNKPLDHEISAPPAPILDPAAGVAAARAAVAAARRVYTDAVATVARRKGELKAIEDQAKEIERQAIADRIVRDGWWVFGVGMVATIVGVVVVAKQFGTGGWWFLFGGAGVAVLGLAMVWLGPKWLLIVRSAVALCGVAAVIGAVWAWRNRASIVHPPK